MPKTNLLDIVDVLETYADLYDIFDDNKFVCKELDKVNEELRAIPYVKAIPIEWLEKYKRVRGWEVTVTTQNAIDNMLNAWEKENE